jgi:hypothetical protein
MLILMQRGACISGWRSKLQNRMYLFEQRPRALYAWPGMLHSWEIIGLDRTFRLGMHGVDYHVKVRPESKAL